MELYLPLWLACAFLASIVGAQKQAGWTCLMLGILFGPVGLIASFAIDHRETCPTCGTRLNGRPTMCPACKTRFTWKGRVATFFPPK